jgi:hypothetical protein
MKRISWPLFSLTLILLAFAAWITDGITLEGERTVYTAKCQDGSWQGSNCTGKLVAGDRYRFRALRAHSEVVFWTAKATTEPSGKFTDCVIKDGRNWQCKPNADFSRTITREMVHGCPVIDTTGQALPFHQISKWRWMLMTSGIPTGNEVSAPKPI